MLNILNMRKEGQENAYSLGFFSLLKEPSPFLFFITKNVLVDFLSITYLNVLFY